MTRGRIRVGLCGLGYYGQHQLATWARMPDVELVGIADADPARAAMLARQHGVERVFGTLSELLAATEVDLVDIATPEASHAALVAEAIAKCATVICQKPLTADIASSEALVAAAERAGCRLIVHENFRFRPWNRLAHAEIAGGRLGQLQNISYRFRPGDGAGAGAYLDRQPYFRSMPRFLIHETGIHLIDLFRWMAGEISAVSANLRTINGAIAGEDAATVMLAFRSGCSGILDANRNLGHPAIDPRLTGGVFLIEGSEASLRIDGDGRVWRWSGAGPEVELPGGPAAPGPGGGAVLAFQQHVVDHLAGKGAIETNALSYLENIRVEEAIYRAGTSRRWETP